MQTTHANRHAGTKRLLGIRTAQLTEYFLRALPRNNPAQFFQPRSLNIRNAPEFLQQFLRGLPTHPRDFAERRLRLPLSPPLPVESDRKTVGLLANFLTQLTHRHLPLQHNRLLSLY